MQQDLDEILLVDKPADWTSFDVVAKIRGHLRHVTGNKKVKVGHGGTLDPFATGLLLVLAGKACKRADTLLKLDKTYEFTIRLGETSTTGDTEGEITPSLHATPVPNDVLGAALGQFVGVISQVSPAYSAIKVGGKRSYDLARAGKAVELPARQVTIHSLELVSYVWPEASFVTHVSSGTYIRTLAEDIGKAVGTGAYCTQLRRTRVGEYAIENARSVQEIIQVASTG